MEAPQNESIWVHGEEVPQRVHGITLFSFSPNERAPFMLISTPVALVPPSLRSLVPPSPAGISHQKTSHPPRGGGF